MKEMRRLVFCKTLINNKNQGEMKNGREKQFYSAFGMLSTFFFFSFFCVTFICITYSRDSDPFINSILRILVGEVVVIQGFPSIRYHVHTEYHYNFGFAVTFNAPKIDEATSYINEKSSTTPRRKEKEYQTQLNVKKRRFQRQNVFYASNASNFSNNNKNTVEIISDVDRESQTFI